MISLWDYTHESGRNEMTDWAERVRLGDRERAQLNAKLDMLASVRPDQVRTLRWFAGTSGDHNHIFKLIVHSTRMLRPMVCWGPLDARSEVTLLQGAIEKDFVLEPADAAARAEKHRKQIVNTNGGRRRSHERF